MAIRNKGDGRVQPGRAGLRRGKQLRIGYAVAACLILSGCSPTITSGPSEETAYIDGEVIPQMVEWWAGSTETFPFSRFAGTRGYEKICVVPEYWSLDQIEDEIGPVDGYHSVFGNAVPENYFAVVTIRKRIAHAAFVRLKKVGVGVIPGKLCVSAEKAVFRRTVRPPDTQPYALLEKV